MTLTTVTTLVLLGVVAVLSPLVAEIGGAWSVPDVVIEIGAGIVIGPAVLSIAHPDSVVTALSDMGLSYLMFLAGMELDLNRIRGRSLQLAGLGWAVSLALAVVVAAALVATGTVLDTLVVSLTLTTTALGTLLPIVRDAGLLGGRFGSRFMAIGSVGEFGPILAVAVLLDQRAPVRTGLLLVLFVAVAVAAAIVAARPQPPKVISLMHRHLQSSAQLPVRISVLLVTALVYLAYRLGLDVLLGAFAAGIAVRLLVRGGDDEIVRGKLEAIGFGLLVPIFFIVSGMEFPLHALLGEPSAFLRVPLFLGLFLIVRGSPVFLLYRQDLPKREWLPMALFSATGLPLIVVITTIGVEEGRMRPVNEAALVAAGMLSVLLYPMLARVLLRRATRVVEASATEPPIAPLAAPPMAAPPSPPPMGLRPQLAPMAGSDHDGPLPAQAGIDDPLGWDEPPPL